MSRVLLATTSRTRSVDFKFIKHNKEHYYMKRNVIYTADHKDFNRAKFANELIKITVKDEDKIKIEVDKDNGQVIFNHCGQEIGYIDKDLFVKWQFNDTPTYLQTGLTFYHGDVIHDIMKSAPTSSNRTFILNHCQSHSPNCTANYIAWDEKYDLFIGKEEHKEEHTIFDQEEYAQMYDQMYALPIRQQLMAEVIINNLPKIKIIKSCQELQNSFDILSVIRELGWTENKDTDEEIAEMLAKQKITDYESLYKWVGISLDENKSTKIHINEIKKILNNKFDIELLLELSKYREHRSFYNDLMNGINVKETENIEKVVDFIISASDTIQQRLTTSDKEVDAHGFLYAALRSQQSFKIVELDQESKTINLDIIENNGIAWCRMFNKRSDIRFYIIVSGFIWLVILELKRLKMKDWHDSIQKIREQINGYMHGSAGSNVIGMAINFPKDAEVSDFEFIV